MIGFTAFFLIPNSPVETLGLTEADKQFVTNALNSDGLSFDKRSRGHFWRELMVSFTQPHIMLIAASSFLMGKCSAPGNTCFRLLTPVSSSHNGWSRNVSSFLLLNDAIVIEHRVVTSFLPSIVVGLGYEGSQAQLMSVPPYAIGVFGERPPKLTVVLQFVTHFL